MSSHSIFCKTLLHGDQWRHDVIITVAPDGLIEVIEPGLPRAADQVLHGIVVPGMPNAHSHAFQRLVAGLTGPQGHRGDSFWSWREKMYSVAGKISPEQYAAVAAGVFVEMLKAGFTTCAEFHYLHHQADGDPYSNPAEMSERLIEAAVLSGMPMTLLPVLYCHADFGKTGVEESQKRFANSPRQYLDLLAAGRHMIATLPLLRLGIAPHSLRAVTAADLGRVLESWPDRECPIHIHIAEQPAEIAACIARHGLRPLEWLLGRFPVDGRWCLVHATHLSDSELESAAASGAVAGLCPTTEADLGDGVFRTVAWLEAGGRFAIGSDSNVRISVAEELRLLEYNQRLATGRRNVLTSPDTTCGSFLYRHAAAAGGIATGQPVGSLEPGFRADLVELDAAHERLAGRAPDVVLDSWVFAGEKSMIDSVWVAGRRVIANGRHERDEVIGPAFAGALTGLR